MALSAKSRAALLEALGPLATPEATEEMLAYFPSRQGDEPATHGDLRVMGAELRTEMAELRTDLKDEMAEIRTDLERSMKSMAMWMSGSMAVALVGGMGLAATIS